MKDIFQVDDFVKLPIEVKTNARTSYEYGKIDRISKDGQVVDLSLVDESDVNRAKLHTDIAEGSFTFCLHHYDINY